MEAREEGGMVEARGTGAGKSPPRGVDFGRRRLGILEDLRKTLDPPNQGKRHGLEHSMKHKQGRRSKYG